MAEKNLLDTRNGRFMTFGLLYISEGVPYGFTSTAMVAFMRTEGLSIESIGLFVAALFLPWAFKWAWAPLIDIIKLHRFGGRRAWIMFCNVAMILTLLTTAALDLIADFQLLLVMIVLHNVFAATQDVAIDSLAVSTLKADERGRGNGFMFGGQYLGIAMGGGGAIFVASFWGFDASLFYVCALLALNLLFVIFFVRDPEAQTSGRTATGNELGEFLLALKSFLKKLYQSFLKSGRGPKVALLLALLPTGSMALAYAILGTIQVDYGLSQNQIAGISIYNTIASAIGCLIGGVLADKFGLRKMLATFFLLTTLPTLTLAFQLSNGALEAIPIQMLYAVIITHGLFFGMGFGVAAAVFMGMTNPAVAATQFTAFMAMANLAISMTNFWQGMVAERVDYATVLYLDAIFVLAPLAVIPFLRTPEEERAIAPRVDKNPGLPAFEVE